MARQAKMPKERSPLRWGMQTKKAAKFRHRADRRPKDARRTKDWE